MLTQSATGTANVAVGAEKNKSSPGKARKIKFAGTMIEKTTIAPPKDQGTYADSGATVHCFHSESSFVPESIVGCETRTVMLAHNTSVKTNFCGNVILPFDHANIRLKRALYIPNLGYNLASTGRLADNGIESHFRRHDFCLMLQADQSFIGAGQRNLGSGMYVLPEPQLQDLEESDNFLHRVRAWMQIMMMSLKTLLMMLSSRTAMPPECYSNSRLSHGVFIGSVARRGNCTKPRLHSVSVLRTLPNVLASTLILAPFPKSPAAYCHRGVKGVLRHLSSAFESSPKYKWRGTDLLHKKFFACAGLFESWT